MQDGKLHLTSICSLKNAKTRLYAGCNDEFEEIFQSLSPMEINNIEFLLDDTPLEATEFLESCVKLPVRKQLMNSAFRKRTCLKLYKPLKAWKAVPKL